MTFFTDKQARFSCKLSELIGRIAIFLPAGSTLKIHALDPDASSHIAVGNGIADELHPARFHLLNGFDKSRIKHKKFCKDPALIIHDSFAPGTSDTSSLDDFRESFSREDELRQAPSAYKGWGQIKHELILLQRMEVCNVKH
jgi:hypothetical protein